LLRATQYTLTISSSLKADDGGVFLGQTVLFKTDNSNAPEVTLSSVKCAGKELTGLSVVEGVSVSADFLLTFSREVKTIPANSIQLKPTGGTAIPVSITQSGAVVTVNPNANILAGVEYTLSIDTTIKATDDGKFAGQFVVFKTVEPVTVTSIKSGSIEMLGTTGLTGVSVSNDFLVTFSKSVVLPTIADFEFKSITGDNVPFSLIHAGSVVTLNPTTDLLNGTTYSITTKQTILATDGGPATSSTVNFKSEGFAVIPQTSHQIAYFGFNNNVNSSIGTWTSTNVSSSFTTDRFGLPNSSVSFNGTTDIIEVDNGAALFTPSSTLSFWVWADTTSGHGLFCMGINGFKGSQVEFDRKCNWFKNSASFSTSINSDLVAEDIFFDGLGNYNGNGGWQGWNFNTNLQPTGGVKNVLAMKWAHIVYCYDAATKLRTVYVNGVKMMQSDFNLWPSGDAKRSVTGQKAADGPAPEFSTKFAFGFAKDRSAGLWATESWGDYTNPGANHFKGRLDDVRFFNVALTEAEVSTLYNAEK